MIVKKTVRAFLRKKGHTESMYYNYHGTAKKLIKEKRLIGCTVVEEHRGIRPALVLYFDGHVPMPIRRDRWEEYFSLILRYGLRET